MITDWSFEMDALFAFFIPKYLAKVTRSFFLNIGMQSFFEYKNAIFHLYSSPSSVIVFIISKFPLCALVAIVNMAFFTTSNASEDVGLLYSECQA